MKKKKTTTEKKRKEDKLTIIKWRKNKTGTKQMQI